MLIFFIYSFVVIPTVEVPGTRACTMHMVTAYCDGLAIIWISGLLQRWLHIKGVFKVI